MLVQNLIVVDSNPIMEIGPCASKRENKIESKERGKADCPWKNIELALVLIDNSQTNRYILKVKRGYALVTTSPS